MISQSIQLALSLPKGHPEHSEGSLILAKVTYF